MWKTSFDKPEREQKTMIARITPLSRESGNYPDNELPGSDNEIDNSLPGGFRPPGNATLPNLPGIWPPPGKPNLPIHITDPGYGHPIIIEGRPDNPIALPPGIYPPLPPSGGPSNKIAVLVWVLGVGYRWAVIDISETATPK